MEGGVAVRRLGISLLGRMRCRTADAEGSIPTRIAARDLFAMLALAPRPLQRSWLSDVLWPDATRAEARANLRRHLAFLEQWLGTLTNCPNPITRASDLLALNVDAIEWIDVRAFEDAVACGDLDAAMSAYCGDLLPDLDYEWIGEQRVRLRVQYDEVLQTIVARRRADDVPQTALRHLQSARAIDPYNEAWLRMAMRLRYASGDRAGALRDYESYRVFVDRELGVEPMPETAMLAASMRRTEDMPSPEPTPLESTSFLGRGRECELVGTIIGHERMLTITGEPGIGKSRLGLLCARSFAHGHRDGTIIVDVASSAPGDLERSLTRALERGDRHSCGATLKESARGIDAVVVLDGCERHAARCAAIARSLLGASADLRVVATSRAPLGVAGETVFRLGPLSQSDAELLFVERLKLTRPEFTLSREEADVVGRICRRLDGVPLAVELAAARGRISTLRHIEHEIESPATAAGLDVLRSAYESSLHMLSLVERTVFFRLAAFAGGWTAPTAQAACTGVAPAEQIVAALAALVNHSLVVPPATTDPAARYSMLSVTRDFAASQSKASGTLESDARAQAVAMARHYIAIGTQLRSERAADFYAEVECDRENVRLALETLWRGDAPDRDLATDLGLALSRFWADQGAALDGAQWLRRSLEHVADRDAPKRLELLRVIGTLTRDLGDYEASYRYFDELALLHKRQDSSAVELGKALTLAANAARMCGRYDDAVLAIRDAHAMFRESGEAYLAAWAVYALGTTYLSAARFTEARRELERATHAFNTLGATSDSSSSIANLALCHYYEGKLEAAHELSLESLSRASATGHRYYYAHAAINEALILSALGRRAQAWPRVLEAGAIATALGAIDVTISVLETACDVLAPTNPADAALLLGVADSMREREHATRSPLELPSFEAVCAQLQASLGGERFGALRTRGRVVPVAEALTRLDGISFRRRHLDVV